MPDALLLWLLFLAQYGFDNDVFKALLYEIGLQWANAVVEEALPGVGSNCEGGVVAPDVGDGGVWYEPRGGSGGAGNNGYGDRGEKERGDIPGLKAGTMHDNKRGQGIQRCGAFQSADLPGGEVGKAADFYLRVVDKYIQYVLREGTRHGAADAFAGYGEGVCIIRWSDFG